jgi:glycosyltransferase involved in cell wall biosynthesis
MTESEGSYDGRRFGETLPSVSIVTICKNAERTIARAMDSVAKCSYPNLQYVVVDGGSTDRTLDTINEYKPYIDKFVSGRDHGISDALNKAVELTDGDYHLVVHADDVLLPDALTAMIRSVGNTGAKVICGAVQVIGRRGLIRRFRPDPRKLNMKMSLPHMGSLIRKDAWADVGRYDLRRRLAMDHLLMLRILNRFGRDAFCVSDETIANYYLGGVSDRHVFAGFREVRDNLIEEGVGRIQANAAYMRLLLVQRLARVMRGS